MVFISDQQFSPEERRSASYRTPEVRPWDSSADASRRFPSSSVPAWRRSVNRCRCSCCSDCGCRSSLPLIWKYSLFEETCSNLSRSRERTRNRRFVLPQAQQHWKEQENRASATGGRFLGIVEQYCLLLLVWHSTAFSTVFPNIFLQRRVMATL